MCKNRKKVNREQETGDRNNLFKLLPKKFFTIFAIVIFHHTLNIIQKQHNTQTIWIALRFCRL